MWVLFPDSHCTSDMFVKSPAGYIEQCLPEPKRGWLFTISQKINSFRNTLFSQFRVTVEAEVENVLFTPPWKRSVAETVCERKENSHYRTFFITVVTAEWMVLFYIMGEKLAMIYNKSCSIEWWRFVLVLKSIQVRPLIYTYFSFWESCLLDNAMFFMIADKEYKLGKGSVRLWMHLALLFITIVAVKGLLITTATFCKSKTWIFFLSLIINPGSSSR